MPLTLILDLALNETAGRKGGDKSGSNGNHRMTSKPREKRQHQYNRTKPQRWLLKSLQGCLPGISTPIRHEWKFLPQRRNILVLKGDPP